MSENRNVTPDAMILDPSGYVVLEFEDHKDRAHWIDRCVPPGNMGFWHMRTNNDKPPFRVTFRLKDLPSLTPLKDGNGVRYKNIACPACKSPDIRENGPCPTSKVMTYVCNKCNNQFD